MDPFLIYSFSFSNLKKLLDKNHSKVINWRLVEGGDGKVPTGGVKINTSKAGHSGTFGGEQNPSLCRRNL
jgi:hypothetical protein